MKTKIRKFLLSVTILTLILGSSAFAAYETITLPVNQQWVSRNNLERNTAYSFVLARCLSVSPTDGSWDNFTKIRSQVFSASGTAITDEYVLSENNTDSTYLYIKDGYLNQTRVNFKFRGNNPDFPANAYIFYDTYID